MFFIGIFGIKIKDKNIKKVKFKCTGCLCDNFHLIEKARYFELFFIPLIKISSNYLIQCENCKSIYEIKKESVEKDILEYSDIKSIVLELSICSCGTVVNEYFTYCPKCGKKIER